MKRRYSEYKNVDFTIEMHKSMWCDDFKNYKIKDLFSDGILYNNSEILKAPKSIKEKINRGYYTIHPVKPSFFLNSSLTGYVYIKDTNGGMRIFHKKD